ncbi:hypothetical protein HYV80_02850 [Candidatus Woesearchaeota archaeon]|nr:hypothetical protein [Candidatus Woesearchaeota archaeon]
MNPEKPYLAIVFGALLFLGISSLWGYRLQHEFPYSYLASDTFQQQTRAEGIKDAGNYRLEPYYIVKGYKDVVGYYPPVLHHLGILLHFSSGIPLYDTIYFMVFFNAILSAFVMYILIRNFSKQIALLSLPLSILLFSNKSYIGFLWGHWASITGQLFLVCIFWAMSRIDIDKTEIMLGAFIGALGLSHTSELIYSMGFIIIYTSYLLFCKKFGIAILKKILIAGIISVAIAFYSLYIFMNSFMVINPYQFEVSNDWGGTPILYLSDFKLLLIFLALGAAASLIMFKKFDAPVIAGLYMLGIGYTNYIGFGLRAFQPRLLWPVYFSFFFGLGIYMLIKLLPAKLRAVSVFITGILFLMVLSNMVHLPYVPTSYKISTQGLMDSWHWNAFQWLGQNTPKDAKLFFFYGDVYDQDAILRNSKRVHAQIVPRSYAASLQNRTIKKIYEIEVPADHGAGMPYMKSFLKIGLHQRDNLDEWVWQNFADVCSFDYFIFDKASRQPALSQYNLLIANEMLKNGAANVFENDVVVILKNGATGGDCIEERNF